VQVLVSLLILGFIIYCLLDVVLTEREQIRTLPRLVWFLVVLFLPLLGGVAWLLAGRPLEAGFSPGSARSNGPQASPSRPARPDDRKPGPPARPSRPRGPDDDPDFLRRIDDQLRRGRRDESGGEA
jgi:hypothetical protein